MQPRDWGLPCHKPLTPPYFLPKTQKTYYYDKSTFTPGKNFFCLFYWGSLKSLVDR